VRRTEPLIATIDIRPNGGSITRPLIADASIRIGAGPERVWQVLTQPEFTRQYMFGCEPVSDWKLGSPLVWRGASNGVVYVKGTIVKIEAGKVLEYTTFNPNAADHYSDTPSNYVTVALRLSEEGRTHMQTKLSVTQGDFALVADGERRCKDSERNWISVLSKIKELCERQLSE